jgi:FtsZ-interacting cell division protein ZipA
VKKKILIAILAVIVVAFLSGCIIFRDEIGKVRHHIYPINKKYEEKNTDNDIEKATKKKEEETSTQTVQKSEEQNTETKNKEEQIENNSNKKEPTKTNSNKTTETSKSTPKNNTPSNSNNNGSRNTNNSVKQEEKPVVVQKQPWEELGLTEDQYKNQPMYSWEEVDFKTKEECMNYGNEHAEYGFECSEVTSWTRSLGWDYKTF